MATLLAVLAGWPWLIRWPRYLRRERDKCYVCSYSTHGFSGNTCPEPYLVQPAEILSILEPCCDILGLNYGET